MWRSMAIFSLILTAFLITSCSTSDAYHRGNVAYEHGHYKTSYRNYLYAAQGGWADAQYAVGYQYFYGLGVERDQNESIKWFERASPYSPRARYALQLIRKRAPQQPWTFQLIRPH